MTGGRQRWLALVPLLLSLGCGRRELDLLVTSEASDPCPSFADASSCAEHTSLGCSFQPNREGCRSDDPACSPGLCSSGDAFVRRVENGFWLNGAPFRFAGVGSWGLLTTGRCAAYGEEDPHAWLTKAFDDLVPARAKVVRLYGFQDAAGDDGLDFAPLDEVVDNARRAGARLLLVLEHSQGDCSQNGARDAAWYTGGYQAPEPGYALAYRDYAQLVAEHYREEPTVLGYVLLQSLGAGVETDALQGFVEDMTQLLHGVAPSQLVSLDLAGRSLDEFVRVQGLPGVDFVDVDDYVFSEPPEPVDRELFETLATLGKPVVVGEGGFVLDGKDAAALELRAEHARARLDVWRDLGASGALLWAYEPGWVAISEEFDARPADPLLQPGGVLASARY